MDQPWKMLIYIAADNNLYEDAQISLREITDSSLFSDVEIVVQVDGPSAEMASRYKCENGRKRLIWEAPDKYTNDRKIRLTDFLNAAAEQYSEPKRIFLVLWGEGAGLDHVYLYSDPLDKASLDGGQQSIRSAQSESKARQSDLHSLPEGNGALKNISYELLNGQNANRYVKDIELGRILSEFSTTIGRPIDILGFDACLMALAEICHEVRGSVSLIVASDEELPKESWPYDLILRDLARFPGMDASTLATLTVSRFIEKYTRQQSQARVSLTSLKLSACEELASAMKLLVGALCLIVDDEVSKRRVFRARDASRTVDEITYIDLGVFCMELSESFEKGTPVHENAMKILCVLKKDPYILYHRDAGEDGSFDPYGLALYFPQTLTPDANELDVAKARHNLRTYRALDPPYDKKDPPHDRKFPPAGGAAGMEIASYQILWDSYVKLEFSKYTGWANLVARLLEDKSGAPTPGS